MLLSALAIFAPKSEAWAEFQPPKIYPPTPGGYIVKQVCVVYKALFPLLTIINVFPIFIENDAFNSFAFLESFL